MKITEASREIRSEVHRSATIAEVAERTDLREHEVIEAMQADRARRTTSLDLPSARGEEDSAPMVETIGVVEAGFERTESEMASKGAELRPKERQALHLRFHEGDDPARDRRGDRRLADAGLAPAQGSLDKLLLAVRGGEELDENAIAKAS